jgi:hypothetical protein
MKFIFDFDDVIIENTKKLKPYIFGALEHQYGISQVESLAEYKKLANEEFSLKRFITNLFLTRGLGEDQADELYKRILITSKGFLNLEMLHLIERLGKENCFLVTNGEPNWQEDKLEATEVKKYFKESRIVTGSKRDAVTEICRKNSRDKVLFVDDKDKSFNDINQKEVPNLTTFHFTADKSVKDLEKEIYRLKESESAQEIRRVA